MSKSLDDLLGERRAKMRELFASLNSEEQQEAERACSGIDAAFTAPDASERASEPNPNPLIAAIDAALPERQEPK